jgi:hypothetical protein
MFESGNFFYTHACGPRPQAAQPSLASFGPSPQVVATSRVIPHHAPRVRGAENCNALLCIQKRCCAYNDCILTRIYKGVINPLQPSCHCLHGFAVQRNRAATSWTAIQWANLSSTRARPRRQAAEEPPDLKDLLS